MNKPSPEHAIETTVHPESPGEASAERGASRRLYAAPRVFVIITADTLLEVLGPAQANYGGV